MIAFFAQAATGKDYELAVLALVGFVCCVIAIPAAMLLALAWVIVTTWKEPSEAKNVHLPRVQIREDDQMRDPLDSVDGDRVTPQ